MVASRRGRSDQRDFFAPAISFRLLAAVELLETAEAEAEATLLVALMIVRLGETSSAPLIADCGRKTPRFKMDSFMSMTCYLLV